MDCDSDRLPIASALEREVGIYSARKLIIGEDCGWSDEDTFAE
jgi:hypothetical protein